MPATPSRPADSGRALRVLHVIPSFYPATYWGGPMYSVHGLCNRLARIDDLALRVATTDSAGPRVSERVAVSGMPVRYPAGYDVYFFRRQAGASVSVGLLKRLPDLVRWADVVHLTGVYSFPTIPTLSACRLLGKPLVWSPRGALQATHEWADAGRRRTKKLWERLCGALVSENSMLHVTSEVERISSLARLPGLRAVLIPNGVDVPQVLTSRERKPVEKLRLMFIGRLDPKKGIENLLQALKLLADKSVFLDIYGAGDPSYESSLVGLMRSLQLDDRVVFRGFVEGDKKRKVFSEADVCIVPSHSENFANVVPEALSFGVPVIVSKGAPWSEVESMGCGLWVDNMPVSLAEAINRIQELDLAEMGARGRRWVNEAFSWDAVSRAMLGTYRQLASRT